MCGIVGHLGTYNSKTIVLDGLEALEYRGYDSAGVSLIGTDNVIRNGKKEGRLKNSRWYERYERFLLCWYRHTRWATHGKV